MFSRCRAILCPSSTEPNVPSSPEDTPSNLLKSQNSIHGKHDTNVGVHSRIKPTFSEPPPSHDTFTIPPSTNTQSAPLPLRPAETRARSERGHRPCCSFWGTRRVISLCLRTEPSYSTTRSSNLIDLSKKLHDRFLQVPFVDMRWWELGFEGLPSLSRMSPGLPVQFLHPHHSPTGRARLVQPTTTRRESRWTRPDRQFPRPPINSMAKNEGKLDDRNYP